jgi:hypothetical protein
MDIEYACMHFQGKVLDSRYVKDNFLQGKSLWLFHVAHSVGSPRLQILDASRQFALQGCLY